MVFHQDTLIEEVERFFQILTDIFKKEGKLDLGLCKCLLEDPHCLENSKYATSSECLEEHCHLPIPLQRIRWLIFGNLKEKNQTYPSPPQLFGSEGFHKCSFGSITQSARAVYAVINMFLISVENLLSKKEFLETLGSILVDIDSRSSSPENSKREKLQDLRQKLTNYYSLLIMIEKFLLSSWGDLLPIKAEIFRARALLLRQTLSRHDIMVSSRGSASHSARLIESQLSLSDTSHQEINERIEKQVEDSVSRTDSNPVIDFHERRSASFAEKKKVISATFKRSSPYDGSEKNSDLFDEESEGLSEYLDDLIQNLAQSDTQETNSERSTNIDCDEISSTKSAGDDEDTAQNLLCETAQSMIKVARFYGDILTKDTKTLTAVSSIVLNQLDTLRKTVVNSKIVSWGKTFTWMQEIFLLIGSGFGFIFMMCFIIATRPIS